METVVQRIERLAPTIVARREEIETSRRMPADLVSALRETGICGMELPRAFGGRGAEPLEILQALETLARADGSTAWCVAQVLAGNCAAGFMLEAGVREVFGDPTTPTAGVFAPSGAAIRVEGGVKVTGTWKFGSGIQTAEWIMGGCLVMETGEPRMTPMGPEAIHVWLPARSIEIHDTWHVSGLCGTGSHDFSAKDLFVPDHRVFLIGDPTRACPEPMCRMPVVPWYVAHVAAVSLGVARTALDEATQVAQKRVPNFTSTVVADQPVAQVELARAEASLAAARALLHESIMDMWRVVNTSESPSLRQVAMARIAAANATDAGATATRTASALGGAGAIYTSSALQRHLRDAEAITHHFTVASGVWEDAGRVFMGRKPTAPMF